MMGRVTMQLNRNNVFCLFKRQWLHGALWTWRWGLPVGVHLSMHRFMDSVLDLKPLYLKMATAREMRETANSIHEKYGIKNFSPGVDGKLFPISGRPRFKEAPTFLEPQGQ